MTDATPTIRRTAADGGEGSDGVVVLNPQSGDGTHVERVHSLARERGFAVRETEAGGDAVDFAREAAERGADLVVAAGGDGTANEVVRGLVAADALPAVELGVVPAGTGNNFAGNVGIEGIDHAFEVLDDGESRRIDLGFADGRPFLNSCVGGLTADASAETDSASKEELGVLAYVLATFRTAVSFEGLPIHVETTGEIGQVWAGDAVMLLVGNARRFPVSGRTQANAEDGLFDVTIVEERPTAELVTGAAVERLLGESAGIARLKTPGLTVTVNEGESAFSLDGEMVTAGEIHLETERRALSLRVGEGYDPDPDPDG